VNVWRTKVFAKTQQKTREMLTYEQRNYTLNNIHSRENALRYYCCSYPRYCNQRVRYA